MPRHARSERFAPRPGTATRPEPRRPPLRSTARPIPPAGKEGPGAAERPIVGIHPYVFRGAVVAAAWFLIVMAISFSGNIESDYLMEIVVGFGVVFFGLTLGIAARAARERRWQGEPASFQRFIAGEVAINTGEIAGREALVQFLTLPITLAIGAMLIGLVFVFSG